MFSREDHTVSSSINFIDIVSEKLIVNSNCSAPIGVNCGGCGKGDNGGKCLLAPPPPIFFFLSKNSFLTTELKRGK